MKHFYLIISFAFMLLTDVCGQYSATILITDDVTALPIQNVSVSLNNETLLTNASGQATFNNLIDNTYEYSFWINCYTSGFESLTISGESISESATMTPASTNNVFFFIGSPMALNGATVILTNNADFYQEFVTSSPWGGEIISDVPFGEYFYSVTTPCYETVSGNVTVDCNNGEGMLVAAEPAAATTNDVFFFIGEPFTLSGAIVTLTDGEDFNQTLMTGAPFGDIIYGVPYGDYSYTVEANCYETITGTITVDCNEGLGPLVAANPSPIEIDHGVSQNENTLIATAAGYNYQWIDCANGNSEIEGETGQSFTAGTDGSYAVIIFNEDCSVTSECTSLIVTGIFHKQPTIEVAVFPNPVVDNIQVRTQSGSGQIALTVISISGQVLINEIANQSEMVSLNVSTLAAGTYVITVSTDEGQYTSLFVKQD